MAITNVTGGKFLNFTNGDCRITVLAVDATNTGSKNIKIYSALMSVPDTGVALPLDTIIGRSRTINDIFNTYGSFAGSTTGTENLIDKATSISLADDFVYLSNTANGVEINKNVIVGMLMGESFYDGSSLQKIIGTNGALKNGRAASSDIEYKALFLDNGRLTVPQASDEFGDAVTSENTRITAYNNSTLCVMLEFMTEFSSSEKQGYRFVYSANSNVMENEGDDYNKISFDTQILCDVSYIDKPFIDGITETKTSEDFFVKDLTGGYGVSPYLADVGVIVPQGAAFADISEINTLFSSTYTNFTEDDYIFITDQIDIDGIKRGILAQFDSGSGLVDNIINLSEGDVIGIAKTIDLSSYTVPFAGLNKNDITFDTDPLFYTMVTEGTGNYFTEVDDNNLEVKPFNVDYIVQISPTTDESIVDTIKDSNSILEANKTYCIVRSTGSTYAGTFAIVKGTGATPVDADFYQCKNTDSLNPIFFANRFIEGEAGLDSFDYTNSNNTINIINCYVAALITDPTSIFGKFKGRASSAILNDNLDNVTTGNYVYTVRDFNFETGDFMDAKI